MIKTSTLTLAAAIVAASVVSPAFAQSTNPTGSQMPHYYKSDGSQTWGSWGPQVTASGVPAATRRSGRSAFARVPSGASGSYDSQPWAWQR